MYAIIETGGKQYSVKEGDIIHVEKVKHNEQNEVSFDKVLLVQGNDQLSLTKKEGKASFIVKGQMLGLVKGPKLTFMKYKKRKNQRRKMGHRQDLAQVKIIGIEELKKGKGGK